MNVSSSIDDNLEIKKLINDLTTQTPNLPSYLAICILSIAWTTYILFFNSCLLGRILTWVCNVYLKSRKYNHNWIKIASVSISLLSGKIMFKGVHYACIDCMIYIQDGWISFAYWRTASSTIKSNSKENKQKKQQLHQETTLNEQTHLFNESPSNNNNNTDETINLLKNKVKTKIARLEVYLSNLQVHYYNSWKIPNVSSTSSSSSPILNSSKQEQIQSVDNGKGRDKLREIMELFSIINIKIDKGRFYFGNKTLPSTLLLRFSIAKLELNTEKSQSSIDEYCYLVKGDLSKFEIILLVNNKLQLTSVNKVDRQILLKCLQLSFEYIQDVPAILTFERRCVGLNNDTIQFLDREPEWKLIINCLKQTQFNYGPWYDSQREHLWKFFFPQTYDAIEANYEKTTLNERRQTSKFDLVINLHEQSQAAINVEFNGYDPANVTSKKSIQRIITFKCKQHSVINCSIPWLAKSNGYQSNIKCMFNQVVGYTNMSFKHFLNCETFQLNLDIKYPLIWNNIQLWLFNIDCKRTTFFFVYEHKYLLQDLMNDWSSKVKSDIRSYVPYKYDINVKVDDIEVILPCNQHNWIDTKHLENNSFLSLLASKLSISTILNFDEYLPLEVLVDFDVKAHSLCAKFIIPEINSNLVVLKLLRENLKYISPTNHNLQTKFDSLHWSKFTSNDEFFLNDYDSKVSNKHFKEDWFECAQSESLGVKITYKYHPSPIIDLQDIEYSPTAAYLNTINNQVDLDDLFDSDRISIKIEIGPCLLLVYGTFFKSLWFIKEAYLSWDQLINEIGQKQKEWPERTLVDLFDKKDLRNFRPLSIDVSLAIHNLNGHLILDLSNQSLPLPIGFTDRLCLELDKTYKETRLQLHVNPINLFLMDTVQRDYDKNMRQGHLCLSSVNVRGHAMFSDNGRTKTDTLEYAWLLEVLLGNLTGHLTPIQLQQFIQFIELFIQLILDNQYDLIPVYVNRLDPALPYKYCVTRFSLDLIDLYLIECSCALNLLLYPIRLSMCDTHTNDYAKGLSAYINKVQLKQFINEKQRANNASQLNTTTATTTSTRTYNSNYDIESLLTRSTSTSTIKSTSTLNSKKIEEIDSSEYNYWFECASLDTCEILLDMQLDKGNKQEQLKFLRDHDQKTKRLYFLWSNYYDYDTNEQREFNSPKCGCVGGCYFYAIGEESFLKSTTPLTASLKYGQSLFYPNDKVIDSQFIMKNKYSTTPYKYELLDFTNKCTRQQQHQQAKVSTQNLIKKISIDKDNYYTASEDDDEDDGEIQNERKKLLKHKLSKASSINTYKSLNNSNNSVIFKVDDDEDARADDTSTISPGDDEVSEKEEENNNDDELNISLKYDMLCPIINSGLPKYCYVKNLSHTQVNNWNSIFKYPYYKDYTEQNVSFTYYKQGFSCSLIDSQVDDNFDNNLSTHKKNATYTDSTITNSSDIKCKANLTFVSKIQAYITPLTLYAFELYLKSMRVNKIHTNTLLTELNTKCQTHCAANSLIKEVISRTQVSLKIPQILLCSLQVGLSQDTSDSSSLLSTRGQCSINIEDELTTLSLMIVCLNSIETQLIDSYDSTAAIFKINKIDTQFRRVLSDDIASTSMRHEIRCISTSKSKLSIDCYKLANNKDMYIMYECSFEKLSIKGIVKHERGQLDKNRVSLLEFDITKIWFSFPEPPISPKGKRKIPYTHLEWNLLSTLSPAVISWLCSIKRLSKPFKSYIHSYNLFKLNLMSILLAGSLKQKDFLINSIKSSQLNNSHTNLNYLNESTRLYLNDANCFIIKLLRIYLLHFKCDLVISLSQTKQQLNSDVKYLKNVINEILMKWSSVLEPLLQSTISTTHTNHFAYNANLTLNDCVNVDYDNSAFDINSNKSLITQPLSGHLSHTNLNDHSISVDFNIETGRVNTKLSNANRQGNKSPSINKFYGQIMNEAFNLNSYFRPLLDFIGIDAPSGTLTDNLFKKFGSLLIGNLNIKSVDINILSDESDTNEDIKTTILSFDSLLLNISVRQEFPARKAADSHINALNLKGQMPKYFTKIDTGVHLNNLKQEINMPLLRLIHQFYTIILDSSEYAHEQEKFSKSNNTLLQFNILSEFSSSADVQRRDDHQENNVWSFIESILNKQETKLINEIGDKRLNKDKNNQKNNLNSISKNLLPEREQSLVSLFAHLNINQIQSRAGLGSLVFTGKMNNIQFSLAFGRKLRNLTINRDRAYEGSLNIRVDSTQGKFTEINDRNNLIIVQLDIKRSHLFSILNKQQNANDFISTYVHIGHINVNVPLRPIYIHSVVYRESQLLGTKIIPEFKNIVIQEDEHNQSSTCNNNNTHKKESEHDSYTQVDTNEVEDDSDNIFIIPSSSKKRTHANVNGNNNDNLANKSTISSIKLKSQLLLDLKLKLDGCEIKAKLLEKPCLNASYIMNNIQLNINNLSQKYKLNCMLHTHYLSFECEDNVNGELIATSINLPGINMNGTYVEYYSMNNYDNTLTTGKSNNNYKEDILNEIKMNIKINKLNHELNAELIAQLVFVTKVFINEINHILLQAVTSNIMTATATQDTMNNSKQKVLNNNNELKNNNNLYYSILIDIGKISITAKTPTNTLLTLSTGDLNTIELTNSFYSSKYKTQYTLRPSIESKFNLQFELKTLLNEQDLYQLASFEAKFDLKNAIKINTFNVHHKSLKEAIIINVDKPRFYIQPGAVDNAILLYLNYRSTYEYWLQQRQSFQLFLLNNSTTLNAPQQLLNLNNKNENKSTISFKIKLNSLGVALPLTNNNKIIKQFKTKLNDCLIITLQETNIYACSTPCFVSKGEFNNFCLRFVDLFDLSSNDWIQFKYTNHNRGQSFNANNYESIFTNNRIILNSWLVPFGSYEICSSTIPNQSNNRPLWLLDVKWKMEGIYVNLDTRIGSWLNKLSSTITRLTDTQFYENESTNDIEAFNGQEETTNDDRHVELNKLKCELQLYKNLNDKNKINEIQLKIDRLNVASYPDKAKKLLVKTRNNIKEQFGFTNASNTQSIDNKQQQLVNSFTTTNDESNLWSSTLKRRDANAHHIRSKSGDFTKRHSRSKSEPFSKLFSLFKSISNEDSSALSSNDKFKQHSIIEENEQQHHSQDTSPTKHKQTKSTGVQQQQQSTTAVDFKLDVKIEIKSGKCVLYANSSSSNKTTSHAHNIDSIELPINQRQNQFNDDLNTNFIFPAIQCKAFYESKHYEKLLNTNSNKLFKKANLYTNIKIDSLVLPQEYMIQRDYLKTKYMCINPVLLDFIEQTLELIPQLNDASKSNNIKSERSNSFKGILSTNQNRSQHQQQQHVKFKELSLDKIDDSQPHDLRENNYFPIDVIVIISMLPSNIRFTCKPQSTIECLLKLPTLELIFSTKNSSNEDGLNGGLSITCCLTDFSLKFYNHLAKSTATDYITSNSRDQRYLTRDHDDKDSLSVKVEFIKININRLRLKNDIRFSCICDIGRAAFTYDMRNIKEIFIVPKIWYRRSLIKRLFLGIDDMNSSTIVNESLIKHQDEEAKDNILLLISLNLAELEIKMNIGSILGHVSLLTNKLKLINKIKISSNKLNKKEIKLNTIIDDIRLISDGGSNGCMFNIKDISSFIDINSNDKNLLQNNIKHLIDLNVYALECRINNVYNHTTPILTLRLSHLYLKLNDLLNNKNESTLLELNTCWDQFHLMITRSTTPDLIILYFKLIDYLNKQFNESKDYIQKECDFDLFYEMKLKQQFMSTNVSNTQSKRQPSNNAFKKNKSLVDIPGGNITLKGNNFTLILFDGNNFKAKSWALFSINEPTLEFSSERIHDELNQTISQQLIFYLGRVNNENILAKTSNGSNNNMASIYILTRESSQLYTQYQSINDWFEYANNGIDAVGLRQFPLIQASSPSLSVLNNSSKKEIIKIDDVFHLPSLQIYFTSKSTSLNNKIQTKFKVEFHDHILMTLSTETLMKLKNTIKEYINERDLLIRNKEKSLSSFEYIPNDFVNKKDLREYECLKWELEPTLRFILKVGKVGDSLGVDSVLKHLGLSQAKSIVPKYIQSGLMDNSNDLLQYFIKLYIKLLSSNDS